MRFDNDHKIQGVATDFAIFHEAMGSTLANVNQNRHSFPAVRTGEELLFQPLLCLPVVQQKMTHITAQYLGRLIRHIAELNTVHVVLVMGGSLNHGASSVEGG